MASERHLARDVIEGVCDILDSYPGAPCSCPKHKFLLDAKADLRGLLEQFDALRHAAGDFVTAYRAASVHRMTVQIATLRHALETVRAECDLPDYIAEFIGEALASSEETRDVRA